MREQPLRWLTEIQTGLQRWRVSISFAFSVFAVVVAEPTVALIFIGGLVATVGAALRAWAAGHLRKDQVLSTGGPYAYTRNPLYLGSFFIGLGVVIACGSWVLVALFLVLFLLLFSSAISRESSHLLKLFPDEYPQYEQTVPRFLPRLTPYRAGQTGFNPALFKSHREHRVGIVLLLIFALLMAKAVWAQARPLTAWAQEAVAPAADVRSKPVPFAEGETLVYEVHFSKLIFSGKMGRLTFTFGRNTEPPLTESYLMKAVAESDGLLTKLFGLNVKDVFESFVDPTDFGVQRTRKNFDHNGKKELELAVFDRKNSSVMFIQRDLTSAGSLPEVKHEPTRPWVQDIVSVIYHLRTLPLTVGETVERPVSDSAKTFDVRIKVLAQEQIQTKLGQVTAFKLQPLIFGEGKLVRRDAEMVLWMTDDARRLPVKVWLQGSFGTATIELITTPGLRN